MVSDWLHRGVLRRPLAVALASSALLLVVLGHASARADVTAVKGSAFGYQCSVTVFGTFSCSPQAATPSVTLASNGSNSPQTANAQSGSATAGAATLFSSGPIALSTAGSLGPTGSVLSSATITGVNASGQEILTATSLGSSCSASEAAVTGSTTITGGSLQTDNGDDDPTNAIPNHPPVTVSLPTNPAANTEITGHIHIGNATDTFRYVFNEQTANMDGSATVTAAHEYLLGPSAVGNLLLGQSVCGVTGTPDTTPPQTTINSGPSGTILTTGAAFGFSSSEIGSTFECKLDGPGATAGSYGACTSPKTYSGLAGGTYTFSVRARDVAGNTDASPATRTFTVAVGSGPPPTAPADRTPPVATVRTGRSQKLGRTVRVRVSCPTEACRASAGGSVRVPSTGASRAKVHKLRTARAVLARGASKTLRPRLSSAARRAIKRALRAGRRIAAKLTIVVVDAAGNKRTLKRRVRLKL